jgi:hypothetical protein
VRWLRHCAPAAALASFIAMTIVKIRTPKRQRSSAPKLEPAMPAVIVTARKPGRWRPQPELPGDPEAEAKVKAFFARMLQPRR